MVALGSRNDEVSQLTDMFNFDFNQLPQEHLVTFDIETFKRGEILVPVSIAVSSTLAGPMYFERSSDKPKDGFIMVSKFMEYLQYLQRELMEQLPDVIHEVIEELERSKDDPGQYHQSDEDEYRAQKKQNQLFNYISNYRTLKVFGFNSRKAFRICLSYTKSTHAHMCRDTHSRTHTHTNTHAKTLNASYSKFDVPVLLPFMSRWAEPRHINITLLKKGTKITHLSLAEADDYVFAQIRDVLSYTSPCNLASFLKQWNAPQAKGCFPHE